MPKLRSYPQVARVALLLAAMSLLSCEITDDGFCPDCVDVDMDRYFPGENGLATFTNNATSTRYLGGCASFEFQQRVGQAFESRGQPIVCVFEGFARPVAVGDFVEEVFAAPLDSGEWRLAYLVGAGCRDQMPLRAENCARVIELATPSFLIEPEPCAPDTPECRFVPLAPNFLCDDGVTVGGPSGVCTRDPVSGICGYEIISCPP